MACLGEIRVSAPLGYLDLVTEVVRGRSPIPEHAGSTGTDRHEAAIRHIQSLKANPVQNPTLEAIIEAGPDLLCSLWDRMSPVALTMCGEQSIQHLLSALQTIELERIPGDLIEAGVWRGGLPILMRAFLHSVGNRDRVVYLADSFQGLPDSLEDPNDQLAHRLLAPLSYLASSRTQVEQALDFFGLRDSQVRFLEGWFSETLFRLPRTPLALARLDGDYYESTRDALRELYPRLSPGGFLIIDDYNLPLGCKRAVDEYREEHSIREEMVEINTQAVFWRKNRV
jgi:hypothetical protein